ncbi:hypothetical protein BDY17DRAFT_243607 [Neohortaea acidophila]|uniref:NDT80 domain-containing protein n=1 Tax=Neohortaea acidophila TaxID=245834 RepID=A0A6A6Q6R3_9PEZI|nr:uncharacterized protein BDY17DRAFT_243607 [Neohortaea acidophila]KAF2487972.1 hypothetical protein BDY17DRAFT_243607 [Neohortaea acidophila]
MDNLSGFDPSTMTYLASQMAHPGSSLASNGADPFHEMLLPIDLPEHQSAYGYAGSDDLTLQSIHPHATPHLHRFSSGYEDPFSDVVSAFDQPLGLEPDPETPSIDRDNKLLGFSLPSLDYALLDYTYRRTTISMSAQLHGMFFLAESPWAAAGDAQQSPTELTCYRRNLFQVTGEVTLPRTLRYIMTEQGDQIPVVSQELVITATESTEGNAVKIISVPWKTPSNPTAPTSEEKVEREPPAIPLDLMNVQELDSDFATFPFQWKRLQFRIATANNGRRKELQQHFVIRLKVMATLATGGKIPVCEIQSGAVIVRGRSPRNFQSRKDLPLSVQAATFNGMPPTSSPYRDADLYAISSPDAVQAPQSALPPSAPINLSLVEDDASGGETPVEPRSAKRFQIPARAPSFSLNALNSPDESADLLYEYFPLGVDEWDTPVDALYRPHVVHHMKIPSGPRDPKTLGKSTRSKRYFSEDIT